MKTFDDIRRAVDQFATERNWDQFHSPKNLSMALSVEAAELMEHFQWLSEQDSSTLDHETLLNVQDEIADIQVYLVRIADKLSINIPAAVENKMQKNQKKYPIEKAYGSAQKYTHYTD